MNLYQLLRIYFTFDILCFFSVVNSSDNKIVLFILCNKLLCGMNLSVCVRWIFRRGNSYRSHVTYAKSAQIYVLCDSAISSHTREDYEISMSMSFGVWLFEFIAVWPFRHCRGSSWQRNLCKIYVSFLLVILDFYKC